MHFEGSSQFRTLFGASVTLVVYILILINTLNILSDFLNNENQTEINRRVDAKFDELGPYSIVDSDFLIAYMPIDPSVGQLRLYQESTDYSLKSKKRRELLTFESCEAHRTIFETIFDVQEYGGFDLIAKMQCLNDPKGMLEEAWGNENFKSIVAEITSCHIEKADPTIECVPIHLANIELKKLKTRLYFTQRSIDMENYENPLRYSGATVSFEAGKVISTKLNTNNLVL